MNETILKNKLLKILKKYWGFSDFRKGQFDIIRSIIENNYTLGILTTGGGKSICYQIAGLYLGGISIVISPLISLMQDQVNNLNVIGIRSYTYNSTLNKADKQKIINELYANKVKFLYISPESLKNETIKSVFKTVKINLLTIDEAHCISIWGHDFRPEYQEIYKFIEFINKKNLKVSAFTATATSQVQKDIKKFLKMQSPKVFLNSFKRHNLNLNIKKNFQIIDQVEFIKNKLKKSPVLVYSSTRNKVKDLALNFEHKGFKTGFYHGGLGAEKRKTIQTDFIKDKYDILFATNAFGMGIDKPNIYTVIHDQIPDSIENYYQEAGRAGRDGNRANAYMNFDWQGVNLRMNMIENNYISPKLANNFYNFIRKINLSKKIDLLYFLEKIQGINISKLKKLLKIFSKANIIDYQIENKYMCKNQRKNVKINLINPNILFLFRYIDFRKEKFIFVNQKNKLKKMVDYAISQECRMKYILNYFSEKAQECRNCDNCLK